jgi:hypothetical protein
MVSSIPLVGEDRTGQPGPTTRRATVSEAADIIGISAEAVRMRIRRGTLPSERHEGTVYVILDTDRTQRVGDMSGNVSGDRTDELLEALRGQVHDLRDQLQAERQGHAEARRLLAAALERIPAIEAPQEPSEASKTVEEQQDRGQPHPDAPGVQGAYSVRGGGECSAAREEASPWGGESSLRLLRGDGGRSN